MPEDLKYRLNQFETSPPAGIWDNISTALDELKEWELIKKQLNDAAVTPPPGNWEKIKESLEPPVVEINKPLRKIEFTVYRVAASIIIVTLLLSGGWKWYRSSVENNNDSNERDLQNASVSKNSLLPSFSIDIQKSTKREKINAFAKNNLSVRSTGSVNEDALYRRAVNYTSIEGSKWLTKETPIMIDAKPIENEELETIHQTIIGNGQNNNYLVIKSQDGQTTRVSLKFAELIDYLVNDFDNDASINITTPDGKNWGQLIKEWREKIIRSGYTPASGNFLDIVEFKEFLRKNQ